MSQKSIRAEIYELKTENNQLREINKLQQKRLDQLEKQSQGDQLMVLTEKTDHILGSLVHLADGYDELRRSTSDMNKMLKVQQAGMSSLQDKVDQIGNNLKLTASDFDKLEQYSRRNNLEIHGIPFQKDEDTNQIVKKVASALKVKLEDSEISTSQPLFDANNLVVVWLGILFRRFRC